MEEKRALYEETRLVFNERIRLGGKERSSTFMENKGYYTPAMGPNMKHKTCPECGTSVEKLSVGGGFVYYYPKC